MKTNAINMFWDLDGVIFKYERAAYVGENPTYAKAGYFRNREIDDDAYSLLERIRDNSPSCNINVLSRGSTRLNPIQRRNIIEDKKKNVAEAIPWLDSSHVIITESSKVDEAIRFLGRSLSKNDVLIDDFNENLLLWQNAGGSAIKYLNGLNTPESYNGPKIQKGILIDIPETERYIYEAIFG